MQTKSIHPKLAAALLAVISMALLLTPPHARGGNEERATEEGKIHRGLQMSPVPLNLAGKDVNLVGLGSYIVNAQASCNDCHSSGPQTQYMQGANPFFGSQPARTNPATFLAGGRNFGPVVPGTPNIVSRNLTPDGAGRTLGGDTFQKYLHTMRTGTDPDHVHPTCIATSTAPCLPPPFDGDLLQIMPWPVLSQMTDRDLLAIYEYLGSIPCVEGGPGEPQGRCR